MSKKPDFNEVFDDALRKLLRAQEDPAQAKSMRDEMHAEVGKLAEFVVAQYRDDPPTAISAVTALMADLVKLSPVPSITMAVHTRSLAMLIALPGTAFVERGPGDTIQIKPRPDQPPLTREQRDLLEWLGSTEYSQFGECHSAALDALVARGLVQVHAPGEHQDGFISRGSSEMQRAVSLTAAGKKEWCRDDKH
jgi:hypothetical protein